MRNRGTDRLFLAAVLAVFAIAPLFRPGYPVTQSGALPAYQLHFLTVGHSGGPASGSGFAYGSFLPYYVADLFRVLGFGSFGALKTLFALSFLISGVAMYLCAKACYRAWLGPSGKGPSAGLAGTPTDWGALLAAVLYLYAPYHLASTYVAGDLGEAMVFPLLPLAGWLCFKTVEAPGWRRASAAFAAAIVLAAIGASGSLFVFAGQAQAETAGSFVDLSRLLSPVWSFGSTPSSGLPVQIGAMLVVLTMIAGSATVGERQWPGGLRRGILWLIAVAGLSTLLMLPFSGILWNGLGRFFVAPFHLLLPVTFSLSLVGGAVVLLLGSSFAPSASAVRTAAEHPGAPVGATHESPLQARRIDVDAPRAGREAETSDDPATRRGGGTVQTVAMALIVFVIAGSYGYLSPAYLSTQEPERFLDARFGSEIVLLDYSLDKSSPGGEEIKYASGEKLGLTLVWQSLAPVKEDLTVFTHLIDGTGKVWAQQDNQPLRAQRPTSGWQTGETLRDPYELTLGPDIPAGEYQLEIGLYNAVSGRRWEVTEGTQADSRVLLGKVEVVR